jgi:hypothetical protein
MVFMASTPVWLLRTRLQRHGHYYIESSVAELRDSGEVIADHEGILHVDNLLNANNSSSEVMNILTELTLAG